MPNSSLSRCHLSPLSVKPCRQVTQGQLRGDVRGGRGAGGKGSVAEACAVNVQSAVEGLQASTRTLPLAYSSTLPPLPPAPFPLPHSPCTTTPLVRCSGLKTWVRRLTAFSTSMNTNGTSSTPPFPYQLPSLTLFLRPLLVLLPCPGPLLRSKNPGAVVVCKDGILSMNMYMGRIHPSLPLPPLLALVPLPHHTHISTPFLL